MSVCAKPVPVIGDFVEILARLGQKDLVAIRDDILAYERGCPLSQSLHEVLNRAECVATANQIMARFG